MSRGSSGMGGSPAWMTDGHLAVQVVMWNPQVFPTNAEQWSQALSVTFWSDGTLSAIPSGTRNGMDISMEIVRVGGGVQLVRFPFGIDGF